MDTHEYQAKKILQQFGISVPAFAVIGSLEELEAALESLGIQEEAILKVQVHAGGRGKAGGVKIGHSREEIKNSASALLGMKIANKQTGKKGLIAHKILISPLISYAREFYLAVTVDREKAEAILIASPEGGMDIEEVATRVPEKIRSFPIDLQGAIEPSRLEELVKFMGWREKTAEAGKKIAQALAKAFVETDASLIEINPLIETEGGDLVALDAKLSLDDNALFRHPDLAELYDPSQLPPSEAEAKKYDLAYVALEGTIGCMVNGAGLAMATMDLIHHSGGAPANFLDVGGGASQEKVAEGFKIILSDPQVQAIFVNIFGGIMDCETLASGLVAAVEQQGIHVPLVVRMEGTNVEKGKEIIRQSGLNVAIARDLREGAQLVNAYTR